MGVFTPTPPPPPPQSKGKVMRISLQAEDGFYDMFYHFHIRLGSLGGFLRQ